MNKEMQTYQGTVEINNRIINWHTTFGQSVKFKCIRCGLSCIGTEVQVSSPEIERIKSVSDKDFYEEYTTVYGTKKKRLKKIDNKCIFLDNNLNCTIHQNRPLLCREYPFKVLFTSKNNAVIDMTYHCGCIIKQEFTKENEIDFGELVKEHYLNAKEDTGDLELFQGIVENVKSALDSPLAVQQSMGIIIGNLVSPIETCALILNFQKARNGIAKLNSSNVSKFIDSALDLRYLEIEWDDFIRKFYQRILSEKNNFVGLEPSTLRKYKLILRDDKCEFSYYYSEQREIVRLDSMQRKIISKSGLGVLKGFLLRFWDRAVTSYDFYLAMDYLREKCGFYPPSIIVQLDAMRFALHCFEFFLHIIAEKNKHDEIGEEEINEAILLLDGAFLTVTGSIIPKKN